MKKLLALCLALLLMPVQYAFADSWDEGLSAAKPFSYVDECDLTQRVGYMMTMPENSTSTPCGIDALTIYLPREDLAAMRGVLTVTDASGAIYAESDLGKAEITPMSRSDLNFYGWGGGVQVFIRLSRALAGEAVYSVSIPEGAFDLTDLTVPSAALDGVKQWTFGTLAYGISAREDSFEGAARPGDSVTAQIILGGEAASAQLIIDSPLTARSDSGEFTENGAFTVHFTDAGEAAYTVEFYDAAGALIGAVSDSSIVE